MRVRRCGLVLIEPREKINFSMQSLCNGGDGIDAEIELLALAPHLPGEVAIDKDEAAVLGVVAAGQWQVFDALAEQHDATVLHRLLDKGLLVGDDDEHASVRARDELLREANWQAHSAVSHYFGRWHGITAGETVAESGLATMAEMFARLGPPPPHVLDRVPANARLPLPSAEPTAVDDLLAQRATCRNFDPARSVDLTTFSRIMHRVYGAQAAYEIHADNVVIKRTSPSGGGLHPTEAYLIVQRVDGLAPGLYHYHPIDHALEPLPGPTGDLREFVRMTVAAQSYYYDTPVLIVMTTRFPRTFWKYRNHTKAYRAVVLDVGHLSQTLYLSATEFGLGAFITGAINEVDIEHAFGLDPLQESPLAVCGFGHRAAACETFEFDPNRKVWPQGVDRPG